MHDNYNILYKNAYILIAGLGRPVVFGFFQLDNEVVSKAEEVLEELQRNLTQKMLPDLPLLHGLVFQFFCSKNFLRRSTRFCDEHTWCDGERLCGTSSNTGFNASLNQTSSFNLDVLNVLIKLSKKFPSYGRRNAHTALKTKIPMLAGFFRS